MAQYNDDPKSGPDITDQNQNVDNYWLFTSDKDANLDDDLSELDGYSFKPIQAYNTDITLRDGNNDGLIAAANSASFHTNDGLVIDNSVYEVNRHWNVPVTITYKDGSDPITVNMIVSRIRDDTEFSGSGPLAGKLVFRFHDDNISAVSKNGTYGLNNIENITFNPTATSSNFNNVSINNAFNDPFPVICFCEGTMLESASGHIAVENLRKGNLLQTIDNGYKPIRWIGKRQLSRTELDQNPNFRPIRIDAGALGNDTPTQTLMVSPQHRVVIQSYAAREMFGSDEVLVPAKKLLSLPGIEVVEETKNVAYYHILMENHEVLLSNGAMTESLYLGEQSLKSLTPKGREEIVQMFPNLQNGGCAMTPVRTIVQGNRDVRQLLDNLTVAAE